MCVFMHCDAVLPLLLTTGCFGNRAMRIPARDRPFWAKMALFSSAATQGFGEERGRFLWVAVMR